MIFDDDEDFELESGQYWDVFSSSGKYCIAFSAKEHPIVSDRDEEIEEFLLRNVSAEKRLFAWFLPVFLQMCYPFRKEANSQRQRVGPLDFYLCYCHSHHVYCVTYPNGYEGVRSCPWCDKESAETTPKTPNLHPSVPTTS